MLETGEIDYKSLVRLVDWHIEKGTDGIVVLGTTGESPTVEPHERKTIITQVISQVKQRIPVIVGTGANSTKHSIELTKQAMELGADAALLVTPYYNKPTQEGLYLHYGAVANAVPIPIILYNVPGRTACDLLPATAKRLGEFANIVALKEATGDLNRLKELQSIDCHMDMLSGDDPSAMEFILGGGKGVISVAANIAPDWVQKMVVAASAGDRSEAEKWNNKLSLLYKLLFLESNPIPAKWILSKMGLIAPGIRLPLTSLSQQYHQSVLSAIDEANLSV